jgi:hypothetical protein
MKYTIKELEQLIANDDHQDCDEVKAWRKELDELKHVGHETINLDNGQVSCVTCQIKSEEIDGLIDESKERAPVEQMYLER